MISFELLFINFQCIKNDSPRMCYIVVVVVVIAATAIYFLHFFFSLSIFFCSFIYTLFTVHALTLKWLYVSKTPPPLPFICIIFGFSFLIVLSYHFVMVSHVKFTCVDATDLVFHLLVLFIHLFLCFLLFSLNGYLVFVVLQYALSLSLVLIHLEYGKKYGNEKKNGKDGKYIYFHMLIMVFVYAFATNMSLRFCDEYLRKN